MFTFVKQEQKAIKTFQRTKKRLGIKNMIVEIKLLMDELKEK